MTKRRPIEERFWPKVRPAGALECWEWTAAASHGYGVFADQGKRHRAHRVAYELMVGPIPPLLVLDHLCRNTLCVNPYHVDPVPLAVNSARTMAGMVNRERILARRYCSRGHDLDDPAVAHTNDKGHRKCRPCKRIRYAEWSAKQPKIGRGRKRQLTVDDVLHLDALRSIGIKWPHIAEQFPHLNVYTLMKAQGRKGAYADYPREAASA